MTIPIQIKAPDKIVDSDNPWRDDELGRKKFVQPLLDLIKSGEEPITIAFDGDCRYQQSYQAL